jgi:hypothetical protein
MGFMSCSGSHRDEPAPGGLTFRVHETGVDQSGSVILFDKSVKLGRCMPDSVADIGGGKFIFIKYYDGFRRAVVGYRRGGNETVDLNRRLLSDGAASLSKDSFDPGTFVPDRVEIRENTVIIGGSFEVFGAKRIEVEIPTATVRGYFADKTGN